MKLIQKFFASMIVVSALLTPVLLGTPVYADHCGTGDEIKLGIPVEVTINGQKVTKDHLCEGDNNGDGKVDLADNPIIVYLKVIINFLAIGVGVVTAISLVIAGFQYMSSRDNPQAIQAAMKRFSNAIIALLLFIFMYAILNFLVPGGLIG